MSTPQRPPHRTWRSPAKRGYLGPMLALLLTLPALLPLLRAGFFVSDDGLFHVYRIAALSNAWGQGVLYPRLFPEFGFDYGQAVLNFYAPASYYPAALAAPILGPAGAAKLLIALGFLLAALAAYGYGRYLLMGTPGNSRELGGTRRGVEEREGPRWKAWQPVAAGLLAAVVYTYAPYHLADAYLRGAIPEQVAFIFPPLILWAYAAAFREENPWPPLLWGTLAWVGLVLTHNLTALLMAPVAVAQLAVLAWWASRMEKEEGGRRKEEGGRRKEEGERWKEEGGRRKAEGGRRKAEGERWKEEGGRRSEVQEWSGVEGAEGRGQGAGWRLAASAGSLALAVGMTAAYWLPVLAESSSVGLALGPSRGYENHLLAGADLLRRSLAYFANPPDTLGRIYPLSWLSLALVVLGLALILLRWRQHRLPANAPLFAFHLALAAVAMFMTTRAALPLWGPLTPILGHLQYPWRFLVLEAVGLMGVAAALPALLPRVRPAVLVTALASIAILSAMAGLRIEPLALADAEAWQPDRMWREDAEAGQIGATWTGEFLPLSVVEQRWALGRPPETPSDGLALQPAPRVALDRLGYASVEAQVDAAAPFQLRLHQFHLPGWNARIDGRPAAASASGELGLVTVDVPAGPHRIAVAFGATPARTAGAAISLLSVAAWVALVWRPRIRKAPAPAAKRTASESWLEATSVAVAILALVLALNGLGIGRRTWTPQPVQATLGDAAVLVAADNRYLPEQNAAEVTLYWLALRQTAGNFKAFVHVLGSDGAVIGQHDGDPVGGFTPTTRWQPGELIRDRHIVPLPADLMAGDYAVRAGLYQLDGGQARNLPADPPTPDNRVDVGGVTVP